MADYLRLRQICLVARELEPVVADIRAILGLEICHRDSGVAKYGLANALLPIGTSFLELVAPVEANTAAGRFLDRSGGHGGYMAIFDCGDPERRRRHAEALGIRVANVIEYAEYLGIQLHPRDCRAQRCWSRPKSKRPNRRLSRGTGEAFSSCRSAAADAIRPSRSRRAPSGSSRRRTPGPNASEDYGSKSPTSAAPAPRPRREAIGSMEIPFISPACISACSPRGEVGNTESV